MSQGEVRVANLQTENSTLPTMGRAVINNPEDPARIAIHRLGYDVVNESIERNDPAVRLAAAEELGAAFIRYRVRSNGDGIQE